MARLRHLGLQLFSLSRLLRPTLCALQAQPACHFHEPDKKSGYRTPQKRVSKRNIKKGMGMIMPELHKLKQEYIDRVKFKNLADFIPFEDGDYEIQWQLDNEEAVADWVFTCDGDNKEGKSSGEFVLGPNKTGIFRGYLNTSLPGDGHTVRAGYCSIRSPQTKASFLVIWFGWHNISSVFLLTTDWSSNSFSQRLLNQSIRTYFVNYAFDFTLCFHAFVSPEIISASTHLPVGALHTPDDEAAWGRQAIPSCILNVQSS